MKLLVVRNSTIAPEGAFGAWLTEQGHDLTITTGEGLHEPAMEAAEAVILLGSAHGVYETHIPWIARQREFTAKRLAQRKPTIGICFGAQMMAAAAGGDSRRIADGTFFRGWLGVERVADPVLAGPWARWHGDTITPPPGAELLAEDAGTVQAFALPRAIAVQFHPEATPAIIESWAARPSTPESFDQARLAAEGAQLFPARREARAALYDWLLRRATA